MPDDFNRLNQFIEHLKWREECRSPLGIEIVFYFNHMGYEIVGKRLKIPQDQFIARLR